MSNTLFLIGYKNVGNESTILKYRIEFLSNTRPFEINLQSATLTKIKFLSIWKFFILKFLGTRYPLVGSLWTNFKGSCIENVHVIIQIILYFIKIQS